MPASIGANDPKQLATAIVPFHYAGYEIDEAIPPDL